MPAVKTGMTPPPMSGMPAPMGGMQPPPNPFAPMPPMPLAGSPQPPMPMQPMPQGQQMMASTADRRRRFGDALEGMLGRNQGVGAVPASFAPRQQMVAPGTPMMRTPTPRPMAMGGEVDIFGYANGGPVQYYDDGGSVNIFDPETKTYSIMDVDSRDIGQYTYGQNYFEDELPADVAYSKQVQANRESLGLDPDSNSAWARYQRGEHWSQQARESDDSAYEDSVDEIASQPSSGAESEINPIDYSQFTGDVGNYAGTPERSALFGPRINIPTSVSQYIIDPQTRSLTTSSGPEMVATSPIGAIKLPARPIDLNVFDWLGSPTYGSLYPSESAGEADYGFNRFEEIDRFADGGSVPRKAMIADEPHMLAYINQDEEALLRSFGGSGISGPGGIPSYPPDSVINKDYGYTSSGFSAADATADDDKPSSVHSSIDWGSVFSSNDDGNNYYEPPGFDFDQDGVTGEGTAVLDNNTTNPFSVYGDDKDDFVVVTGTSDSSDADYVDSGSSETDFTQPVVVTSSGSGSKGGGRSSTPAPAPVYTDRRGNEYSSQAEADAADRAFAAQAASYGAGQETVNELQRGIAEAFPNASREEANRLANKAYLDYGTDLAAAKVGEAPLFSYAGIGGIGGSDSPSGAGVISEPFFDPIYSQVYQPSFLNEDVKAAFLGGIPSLEGEPVINLNAPVRTDIDAGDPRGDQIVSPTGTGTGLQSDLQRGLGTPSTVQDVAPPEAGYTSLSDIKGRVARAEGTADEGGYGRLLGGQEGRFGVDLTNMTVQEVLDFQKQRGPGSYAEYSQGVNEQRGMTRDDGTGVISTPAGKYQVVGSTLQSLVDQGIVDPNAKFDEGTQERIGTHLIMNDLAGGKGLSDLKSGDITQEQFEAALGKQFEGIERGLDQGAGATSAVIGAASETAKQVEEDRREENVNKIKEQIGDDVEPTGVEAFFYDVIGQLGFGLGKGLADDLRDKSREERQSIINQHVYALQNGATPKTDEEGNYIGFDISTMDTFADKVLGAEDITQFLPGGAEDADGDGVPDYVRFGQVYDAQSAAAAEDPYGMSTEQGFITSDGREFFVDAGGNVVEVTDDVVPFEVGGGQDVAAALGVVEEGDGGDDGDAATAGPDTGHVDGVCNNPDYVYNPETDMCEPPKEEDTDGDLGSPINAGITPRSFDDVLRSVVIPAPRIAPISENIRPMKAGGMVGLNRAADNFIKALAG